MAFILISGKVIRISSPFFLGVRFFALAFVADVRFFALTFAAELRIFALTFATDVCFFVLTFTADVRFFALTFVVGIRSSPFNHFFRKAILHFEAAPKDFLNLDKFFFYDPHKANSLTTYQDIIINIFSIFYADNL